MSRRTPKAHDRGTRKCGSSSSSDCTPAATASLTMSAEMSMTPQTPQTLKSRGEREHNFAVRATGDAENDSAYRFSTPSQPLRNKLRDLEERWSLINSQTAARSCLNPMFTKPSQPKGPAPLPVVETPDTLPARGGGDSWGPTSDSVFDRLYLQGRAKLRQSRANPSQSVDESTISTLTSSESVFDRLYRNEKRKDPPQSQCGSQSVGKSFSRRTGVPQRLSASASLERRLAYTPPGKRRNRVARRLRIPPERLVGSDNLSPIKSTSLDRRQQRSHPDSVFERLYRREKRQTSSLIAASPRCGVQKQPIPVVGLLAELANQSPTLRPGVSAKETILDFLVDAAVDDDMLHFDHIYDNEMDTVHSKLERIRLGLCATKLQRCSRKWLSTREVRKDMDILHGRTITAVMEIDQTSQYLSVLRMECAAVETIQNAWQVHTSQLAAAYAQIQSWSIDCCYLDEGKRPRPSSLDLRIRINAMSRAIGRVDFWEVNFCANQEDNMCRIRWVKEVGVHFLVQDAPILERCVLRLQCVTDHSFGRISWGRRARAILTVKAVLAWALRSEKHKRLAVAARMIQAWGRMVPVRLHYLRTARYAKSIQRRCRARTLLQVEPIFAPLRRARGLTVNNSSFGSWRDVYAKKIQSLWRGATSREHLRMKQYSVLSFQSCRHRRALYGGKGQCRIQLGYSRAAVRIQSQWRGTQVCREYAIFRHVVVKIQSFYRMRILRQANGPPLEGNHASRPSANLGLPVVSTAFAAFHVMQNVEKGSWHQRRQDGAILIQGSWRGARARHTFLSRRAATIKLQGWLRSLWASTDFNVLRTGVLSLQCKFRRRLSRRLAASRAQAARTIQSVWKDHMEIVASQMLRMYDVGLQVTHQRNSIATSCSEQETIPRQHGGLSTTTRHGQQFLQRREAAVVLLQLVYFGWKLETVLLNLRSSVVLLQRSLRLQLPRSATSFALRHINECLRSTVVEKFRRVAMSKRTNVQFTASAVTFLRTIWFPIVETARNASALVIQSATRRMIAHRSTFQSLGQSPPLLLSQHFLLCGISAVPIEDMTSTQIMSPIGFPHSWSSQRPMFDCQGHRSVDPAFRIAAMLIQTKLRAFLQQRRYKLLQSRAVFLQRITRGVHTRASFLVYHGAAVHLQRCWRGTSSRRAHVSLHRNTAMLQAYGRMRLLRRRFQTYKYAILSIQAAVRGLLIRRSFRKLLGERHQCVAACISVQRRWRDYVARTEHMNRCSACVVLQSQIRRYLGKTSYCRKKEALRKLQRVVYRWLRYCHSRRIMELLEQRRIISECESQARREMSLLLHGNCNATIAPCLARLTDVLEK